MLGCNRVKLESVCRELGRPFRIWRIRRQRGRVAWSIVTGGLLVSREAYGEQVKRFYVRGLAPAAERNSWQIEKVPHERGYDRRRSPRAWQGNVSLVPPEFWSEHQHDKRTVNRMLAHAGDPESVRAVMDVVSNVVRELTYNRAAKPLLSRESVLSHYREQAARVRARNGAARAATVNSPGPPSEGGLQVLYILLLMEVANCYRMLTCLGPDPRAGRFGSNAP